MAGLLVVRIEVGVWLVSFVFLQGYLLSEKLKYANGVAGCSKQFGAFVVQISI